jgi:hypothetical protein
MIVIILKKKEMGIKYQVCRGQRSRRCVGVFLFHMVLYSCGGVLYLFVFTVLSVLILPDRFFLVCGGGFLRS